MSHVSHIYMLLMYEMFFGNRISTPGDVAAQLTAPPPTCPDDTFTFTCTVDGDRAGFTIWRVGGSDECLLAHRTVQSFRCGPGSLYTVTSGTGFGDQNATNFTSILSVTADRSMADVLVECFGPLNSVDAGNRVGSSTIQIIGTYIFSSPMYNYVNEGAVILKH